MTDDINPLPVTWRGHTFRGPVSTYLGNLYTLTFGDLTIEVTERNPEYVASTGRKWEASVRQKIGSERPEVTNKYGDTYTDALEAVSDQWRATQEGVQLLQAKRFI